MDNRLSKLTETTVTADRLAESLRDGALLCRVANVVQPGSVEGAQYEPPFSSYILLQNAKKFLDACQSMGVAREVLFKAEDLGAGRGLPRVLQTLYAISAIAVRDAIPLPAYLTPLEPEAAQTLASSARLDAQAASGTPPRKVVKKSSTSAAAAAAAANAAAAAAAATTAALPAPIVAPVAVSTGDAAASTAAAAAATQPSGPEGAAASSSAAGALTVNPGSSATRITVTEPQSPTLPRNAAGDNVHRYVAESVVPKVDHLEYIARGSVVKVRGACPVGCRILTLTV